MRLICAIVGVKKSLFSVRVEDSDIVDELKEAIKAQNEIKGPANTMQLFLAKASDNKWLSYDNQNVKILQEGAINADIQELMRDEKELQAYFTLEDVLNEMDPPSARQIHVLVKLPDQEADSAVNLSKEQRSTTTLFCVLVGMRGGSIPVNLDTIRTVAELKKAIKAKKPNKLKNIDADKLQLFLAKASDNEWLPSSTQDVKQLKEGQKTRPRRSNRKGSRITWRKPNF